MSHERPEPLQSRGIRSGQVSTACSGVLLVGFPAPGSPRPPSAEPFDPLDTSGVAERPQPAVHGGCGVEGVLRVPRVFCGPEDSAKDELLWD